MTCENYKELLMGYLDGELSDRQEQDLKKHLADCPRCSQELEEFKKLKQITDEVALLEPEDKIWDTYWSCIYNRLERSFGWLLLSIAAIILLFYGGFRLIEQIVKDPTVDCVLKAALVILIAALAVLLVSVLRERLYFHKKDRYKDVRR